MITTKVSVFSKEMKEEWLTKLESCRLSLDFLKKELLKLHRKMSRHLLKVGNGNYDINQTQVEKHKANMDQSCELCTRFMSEQRNLDKLGREGHKNGYINLDFP